MKHVSCHLMTELVHQHHSPHLLSQFNSQLLVTVEKVKVKKCTASEINAHGVE